MAGIPEADAAVGAFLEMIAAERGASGNTVAAYRRDLTQFFETVPLPPKEVGRRDISNYLAVLAAEGISARSQSRKLSALREFFRFLCSEGEVKETPLYGVGNPKTPRKLPSSLSEGEMKLLIDACDKIYKPPGSVMMRAALELLYGTGLRVSELVSLPFMDRPPPEGELLSVVGKGRKERGIPLSDAAREALRAYLGVRDELLPKGRRNKWLFPAPGGSKEGHMTRISFFLALKSLAKEAKIEPERVFPHAVRHSFASHLLAHDADLRAIQTMLGHADLRTTQIYTDVMHENKKKLLESAHPLSRSGRGAPPETSPSRPLPGKRR